MALVLSGLMQNAGQALVRNGLPALGASNVAANTAGGSPQVADGQSWRNRFRQESLNAQHFNRNFTAVTDAEIPMPVKWPVYEEGNAAPTNVVEIDDTLLGVIGSADDVPIPATPLNVDDASAAAVALLFDDVVQIAPTPEDFTTVVLDDAAAAPAVVTPEVLDAERRDAADAYTSFDLDDPRAAAPVPTPEIVDARLDAAEAFTTVVLDDAAAASAVVTPEALDVQRDAAEAFTTVVLDDAGAAPAVVAPELLDAERRDAADAYTSFDLDDPTALAQVPAPETVDARLDAAEAFTTVVLDDPGAPVPPPLAELVELLAPHADEVLASFDLDDPSFFLQAFLESLVLGILGVDDGTPTTTLVDDTPYTGPALAERGVDARLDSVDERPTPAAQPALDDTSFVARVLAPVLIAVRWVTDGELPFQPTPPPPPPPPNKRNPSAKTKTDGPGNGPAWTDGFWRTLRRREWLDVVVEATEKAVEPILRAAEVVLPSSPPPAPPAIEVVLPAPEGPAAPVVVDVAEVVEEAMAPRPPPPPPAPAPVDVGAPPPPNNASAWATVGTLLVAGVVGAAAGLFPGRRRPEEPLPEPRPVPEGPVPPARYTGAGYACKRCGHRWVGRGPKAENRVAYHPIHVPMRCPACHSAEWDATDT